MEHKWIQWVWLIALAFIWGSSFILIKHGLEVYNPPQVAAYRMFFAGIVLLPLAYKNLKWLKTKKWMVILSVAFIGNGIPAYLFALGQTHISSTLAGLLNSITPIATLIVGYLIFKTQYHKINFVGLFLGMIGAVGLILSANGQVDGSLFGSLLIVLAGIMYAFNLNIIKHKLVEVHAIAITSLSFLMTLPAAISLLTFEGFGPKSADIPFFNASLLAIFVLALFSSAIAVIGFNMLVKHTSAVFASTVTYVIPVFAIMWGTLDGESIQLSQILWMIVIIGGIYLVTYKGKVKQQQ
jgi:drug/metabolite transporter (DMT)-like permease